MLLFFSLVISHFICNFILLGTVYCINTFISFHVFVINHVLNTVSYQIFEIFILPYFSIENKRRKKKKNNTIENFVEKEGTALVLSKIFSKLFYFNVQKKNIIENTFVRVYINI